MTTDTQEPRSDIEVSELVAFLREQRDEYQELYDETESGSFKQYPKGRYHAYCDVLAWLYAQDSERA